jgi:hypothetical protein
MIMKLVVFSGGATLVIGGAVVPKDLIFFFPTQGTPKFF